MMFCAFKEPPRRCWQVSQWPRCCAALQGVWAGPAGPGAAFLAGAVPLTAGGTPGSEGELSRVLHPALSSDKPQLMTLCFHSQGLWQICLYQGEETENVGKAEERAEISGCPFIFVYSSTSVWFMLIGVFELQLCWVLCRPWLVWCCWEGLLHSPSSGQSHCRALPFLCLTSDLWKQELIKSSEVAKRKGKCLVTN